MFLNIHTKKIVVDEKKFSKHSPFKTFALYLKLVFDYLRKMLTEPQKMVKNMKMTQPIGQILR
jgi:hypothetical protein